MPRSTRTTVADATQPGDARPLATPTLEAPMRQKLPRGASSLPKEVVEAEQRKRLIAATAKVVAAKGYAETTVTHIIEAAGVSRATFYELFKDKEECFLYGFNKLSEAHIGEAQHALNSPGELPQRLRNAISSYLRRVDVDQTLARAFITEAEGATPRSRKAYLDIQTRLQSGLRGWLEEVRQAHPEAKPCTPEDISLVMNGLTGHLIGQVRRGIPFTDEHVDLVVRFAFAGFHLYGWADHLEPPSRGKTKP